MKNTELIERLEILLKSVREWAEEHAPIYGKYTEVNPYDLTGMCAPSSVRLYTDLKLAGLEPELLVSYFDDNPKDLGHVFIRCNGFILDPTATQFGGERIFMREATPELLKHYPYKPYYISSDSGRFILELQDHGWGPKSLGLEIYEDSDSGI